MTIKRNIRSMHVQACQTADISFNMPGVIEKQNYDQRNRAGFAQIGSRVTSVDLQSLIYDNLHETTVGDDSTLKFNSKEVLKTLAAQSYIFSLRNEGLGAALDQAILQRAAGFLQRHKYAGEMHTILKTNLPILEKDLKSLLTKLDDRNQQVTAHLTTQGLTSPTLSRTKTQNKVVAMGSSTIVLDAAGDGEIQKNAKIEVKDGNDKLVQKQETVGYTATFPMERDSTGKKWNLPQNSEIDAQVSIAEVGVHPILDTEIMYLQNRLNIIKETIQTSNTTTALPTMIDSIVNELKAIDMGIRTLQINLAHTFLFAPFDGIVTAIYKDLGESVEAGEPVLRIENDSHLFFVGIVQNRGAIWPGRDAKITLGSIFEEDGNTKQLNAKVLSVRGHSSDSDEWDLLFEVKNPKAGSRNLLPINYQLDPQTDYIEFV